MVVLLWGVSVKLRSTAGATLSGTVVRAGAATNRRHSAPALMSRQAAASHHALEDPPDRINTLPLRAEKKNGRL
jgi:hypothetical protein